MAKSPPARTRPRPTPRQRKSSRTSARTRQIVVVAVAVLVVVVIARGLAFRGDVAPGISVAGVGIGGLSEAAAKERLRTELAPRLNQPVAVTLDRQDAEVVPGELDARINLARTVDTAMRTGRLRSLLLPFVYAKDIEPVIAIPPRPRIPANLRIVAEPARSASVSIADGKAVVSPARKGRSISPRGILMAASEAALRSERSLTLTSTATAPAISTAEARAAAGRALDITSAPITLFANGKRVGALSTSTLENAVMVRNEDGKAQIAFKPAALAPAIGAELGELIREPVNALWETNGQTAWVVPAANGAGFKPRAAADAVRAAAMSGGARQAEIELTKIEPSRSTAEAETFGITTKVAGAITELGDSSANRIHNVALMAQILDNRLVMPGETFSFNGSVGPRSPERGFLEGQAIVGGMLIPSIGGGVCQVATTLYDAAFAMGLDIVERTNHSFYIYHYGEGMDATVAWEGPDLKFRNSTNYPVLIRATADNSTMIVNLYSHPSDLTVETRVGKRYNVKPSEKRYISDEFAQPKSVLQYTTGQEGFSVDVTRIVRRDGEVISESTFASTYVPEAETYILGPGAFPPGDAIFEAPPEGWVSPNAPADASPDA